MGLDWAGTYDEYAAELCGYLSRLVGDRESGADLVQETFVRAMRAEHSLRDRRALRAWLYRTGTNLALSERRRRRVLAFLPFSGTEAADAGAFDIEAHHVRTALRSIPFDQAATLMLFYEGGFSRVEIGGILGRSEEAVKSRLARGRKNFIAAYGRLERGLAR